MSEIVEDIGPKKGIVVGKKEGEGPDGGGGRYGYGTGRGSAHRKEAKMTEAVKAYNMAVAMDKMQSEKDLYHFYKRAFEVLEPGTPYIDNWHIQYLCFILQNEFERICAGVNSKYSDIIINVPPRTSKSLIFSVVFPAWCWVRRNSFKLITTSYAIDLANNFSFMSQQLMRSKWFRERWPIEETFSFDRRDDAKESTGHTVNNKGGSRKTASTGSNLTGFGGDIIIQDDPQSPRQAKSEKETQAAVDFYTGTLSSRLNNQNLGVIITVMQRLDEDDMTSYILEHGDSVLHICLPARRDGTEKIPGLGSKRLLGMQPYPNGILFPGLLDDIVLRRIEKRLGKLVFATQYGQRPFPAEGLIAKRDHFTVISPQDFDRQFGSVGKIWNMYADTSYGERKRKDNDPTSSLSAWWNGDKLYIRKVESKKVPSHELHTHLETFCRQTGYTSKSKLKIEPRSSGPTAVGMLKKHTSINVEDYKFPRSSGLSGQSSKEEKFRACMPFIGELKVVLIDGAWVEGFLGQVTGFPQASHDDEVDCLIMAILDAHFGRMSKRKGRLKVYN